MSKDDPRQVQREFAHQKFCWLEQVAVDGKLPSLAARLAIVFCPLFNLEYGGRAWAYQDTLARWLGVERWSINKALQALVEHGHLTSVRQGRDKPNHYYFVLKEEDHDVRSSTHHKDHECAFFRVKMCAPAHTDSFYDTGDTYGVPR